jgi:hypothetical protein
MANINVTGPDGSTFSFPEGTSGDVIANAMRGHYSAPAAAPPDKYTQAAQGEYAKMKAAGFEPGYARRVMQGATFGGGDEIMAALNTPLQMISHGTINPVEGYNYAKALEDAQMADARNSQGVLGEAAEIAGGLGSAGGIGKAGFTLAKDGAGLASRALRLGGEGAAYGGTQGFLDGGNSLEDRLGGAAKGAAVGGVVGGALPLATAAVGTAVSPIVSNIRARINPEGVARSQVARALSESGMTPDQVAREVSNADAAGQPFTVADAMGNPGQRMLSTVARTPGPGRTATVDFLNARQAGQAERVGQVVDEALGANATARQTTDALIQRARQESAPFYQKALDFKPAWNERIQQFFDDPVAKAGLREGAAVQRLESLASGSKFNPTDYAIIGFNEAGDPIISNVPNMRTINLIKKGWDNLLEQYRDPTTGRLALDEKGRALDAVRRSFLNEIDKVNPYYAKARAAYAGPAQVRDAVVMGGRAAGSGRATDNLAQFNALPDASQQGFRVGYADKLAGKFERGAEGVNAVRPLTSEKATQELGALSLHQGPVAPGQLDPLSQRLARETRMFETRNHALGGSRTADNLADEAELKVDPAIIANLVGGHYGAAARQALAAGGNVVSGSTPAVREQIARILLQRGQNPTITDLAAEISGMQRKRAVADAIMRGLTVGTTAYLPSAR